MFGLKISSGAPVPGMSFLPQSERADVRIEFSPLATEEFRGLTGSMRYRSPSLSEGEAPNLIVDELLGGDFFRMRYLDGSEFVVDRAGTRIFASWSTTSSAEDAAVYLLGPVSGLLLYLRGVTCLHASAIEVDGRAALFVGGAEAGKSTTAATFAKMGIRVLTDDIAAIMKQESGFIVMPGASRVLLWPPSVQALWGDADALPRLVANWEKCYFDLTDGGLYRDRAAKIAAIYVLEDRSDRTNVGIAPLVEGAALQRLLANTYVTRIFEPEQRRRDFLAFSEIARQVPMRSVYRPDDRNRLGHLCDAVLGDLGSLV